MAAIRVHPSSTSELAARASRAVAARSAGRSVRDVRPLPGGSSSLTYQAVLEVGSRLERVVVKVAPAGLAPIRNRDVLRQARVLEALSDAPGVLVPEVLGTDAGDPPDLSPLFVMRFVPGQSFEPVFDGPDPSVSETEIRDRADAAATMMAALHAFDPANLGEKETSLVKEVGRWDRAFQTVDDELRGGGRADSVRDALLRSIPEPLPPVVLHGDYRLGNMQCEGSSILGLIDWEIWSIGDPRLDLAWFLLNSDPAHPNGRGGGAGMPASPELQASYERAAGASVSELRWFAALVRYKQAAAGALITKNARRAATTSVDTARTAPLGPKLLDWARDYLD